MMMTTKSFSYHLLLLWHGLLAGGYTVAFLTSEGGHAVHRFAGYVVLTLVTFRLIAAVGAGDKSPWALPWARRALWHDFWRKVMAGDRSVLLRRTPLMPLSGLMVLTMLVVVGLSGLTAGWWDLEHLPEGIAESPPAVVLVHIALVSLAPILKFFSEDRPKTKARDGC